jgi:apolipoprotein D and lipocalin family protein
MRLCGLLAVVSAISLWWIGGSLKSAPEGTKPLESLDLSLMKGSWFEVARLDNDVESGFGQTILNVEKVSEDHLKITFADLKKKLKWESVGYFDPKTKVGSFFVPCFWFVGCGYHIIEMDMITMSWVMVAGHDFDQLWILSRAPALPKAILNQIIRDAEDLGFDTESLVVNNLLPPDEPSKPSKSNSSPDGFESSSFPKVPIPETPANEPPTPLYLPAIPSKVPAVPKDIPAIPRDIPQFGKEGTTYVPEVMPSLTTDTPKK